MKNKSPELDSTGLFKKMVFSASLMMLAFSANHKAAKSEAWEYIGTSQEGLDIYLDTDSIYPGSAGEVIFTLLGQNEYGEESIREMKLICDSEQFSAQNQDGTWQEFRPIDPNSVDVDITWTVCNAGIKVRTLKGLIQDEPIYQEIAAYDPGAVDFVNYFYVANYRDYASTELPDLFESSLYDGGLKAVEFTVAFDEPGEGDYVGMNVRYSCFDGDLSAARLYGALRGPYSTASYYEPTDVNDHWFFVALGEKFCRYDEQANALPVEAPTPKPEAPEPEAPRPTTTQETTPEPDDEPGLPLPDISPEPTTAVIPEPTNSNNDSWKWMVSAGAFVLGATGATLWRRKRQNRPANNIKPANQANKKSDSSDKLIDFSKQIFSKKMLGEIEVRERMIDQVLNGYEGTKDKDIQKILDSFKTLKKIISPLKKKIKDGKTIVESLDKLNKGDPKNVASAIKSLLGIVKGAAPILKVFSLQLEVSTAILSRVFSATRTASSALNNLGGAMTADYASAEQEKFLDLAAAAGDEIEKILSPEGFVKDMSDAVFNHIFKGAQDELSKYVPESLKSVSKEVLKLHADFATPGK